MHHLRNATLTFGLLLPCAATPSTIAPSFPGPYVSFSNSVYSSGAVLSGSTSYNIDSTDSYGDRTVVHATLGSNESSSTWGVMHLYSQVTFGSAYNAPGADATEDLQAGDTITPISSTLAPGTLVPFLFTFQLQYTLATSGPFQNPYDLDFGGAGLFIGSEWLAANCGYGTYCAQAPVIFSVIYGSGRKSLVLSETINLAVGQPTNFVQELWSGNRVSAPGTGTFDASNTAWLNITSQNSNVDFTTASGFKYTGNPETPEPGTFLMLSGALVALRLTGRLRKGGLRSSL